MKIMRVYIACLLLTTSFCGFSQGSGRVQDVNGRPYFEKNYNEYRGSPYLFPSWAKASVITSGGNTYSDMLINIDVYNNMPVFIKNDTVYSFTENIKEFVVTDNQTRIYFSKGSAYKSQLLPDVFMQKLNESPVFLKQTIKRVVEVPTYDSPNKVYRFQESVIYYTETKNGFEKINLNKKDAGKIFFQKWSEVEKYAGKNDISFKSEEGWCKLFDYYKTL
jgi:hypothetical protein